MTATSAVSGHDSLQAGSRIGRYVILRDSSGTLHAVSPTAVSALCQTDDGTVLLLPGGRMIALQEGLYTVLSWLDMRG
jgi:hypothetical protein